MRRLGCGILKYVVYEAVRWIRLVEEVKVVKEATPAIVILQVVVELTVVGI